MGANRLQKSWDLFHLRRTWFETVWVEKWEAELESSIFIGFLTPEQMLILPCPSVPCSLRFRCGVTSLSGLALGPGCPIWANQAKLYWAKSRSSKQLNHCGLLSLAWTSVVSHGQKGTYQWQKVQTVKVVTWVISSPVTDEKTGLDRTTHLQSDCGRTNIWIHCLKTPAFVTFLFLPLNWRHFL